MRISESDVARRISSILPKNVMYALNIVFSIKFQDQKRSLITKFYKVF